MFTKTLFFILFIGCISICNGQGQGEIDSLVKLLPGLKEDTNKVFVLRNISASYSKIDPDKGISYGLKALSLAEKLSWLKGIAFCNQSIGVNYKLKADYTKALECFQKAMIAYTDAGNIQGVALILGNIGNIYLNQNNYPEAIKNYKQSLAMVLKSKDKNLIAKNTGNIGVAYQWQGNYTLALEYYNTALTLYKQTENKSGIGLMLGAIGDVYVSQADYPKALASLQHSLTLSEQTADNRGIADNSSSIGQIYFLLGNNSKALSYFLRAMELYELLGAKKYTASITNNIGEVYRKQKKDSLALQYFEKALLLHQSIGNKQGISTSTGNIGVIYQSWKNQTKALEYYQKALAINMETGDKEGVAFINYNIGSTLLAFATANYSTHDVQMQNNSIDSAIKHLDTSVQISKKIGSLNNLQSSLKSLSEAYELKGDYINAYNTYKEHTKYKDSIFNDSKENEITRLEIQYEFSKKEDSLKFINQLSNERLQQQILLSEQQEQALLLSGKEKDLQRLDFLRTQAELQLQKETKEKLLSLAEKEKQLQKSKLISLDKDNSLNKLRLRQQWLYSAGGLLLLSSIGGFIISRNRTQQIKLKAELAKEKAEQEKKEAEFQRKMSDVALSSLRAQMNPHFIFNCLNSIRLYAAKNDSAAATSYLSRFSRLMRLVLENSKSERITLKQELETIQLYIEMEAMRFKEKLKYSIVTDENIDQEFIELPPMLIQPYIENAIWHGLMHKEEGGNIDIHISEKEETLSISITDNGIGRQQAAVLKSKSAIAHKSFGMNITNERLELINQKYRIQATITINDLYEAGVPAGTKVLITLPIT